MSQLQLTRVRQSFARERIADVEAAVACELNKLSAVMRPGMSLAIAAGSRGIANIAHVVKATVEFSRNRGVKAFIVPAMGSHGGATAEGQAALLASYG